MATLHALQHKELEERKLVGAKHWRKIKRKGWLANVTGSSSVYVPKYCIVPHKNAMLPANQKC